MKHLAERILMVDDDPVFVDVVSQCLSREGYEVTSVDRGAACIEALARTTFDLVLLDIGLPDTTGDQLLSEIRALEGSGLPVIIITGEPSIRTAVHTLKLGAQDYLMKPVKQSDLLAVVERTFEECRGQVMAHRIQGGGGPAEEKLVGASSAMERIRAIIRRIAATPHTGVLIRGETGTGKTLVARVIHEISGRADAPFVTFPCPAIPDSLLEVELFGVERGAFTDASEARPGAMRLADHGTLFLDEIGHMPLALQAKLLTAIEQKIFRPLGSVHEVHVDVRIVSATNRDLEEAVASEDFRSDLYYRLNTVEVVIPPLRERREDIPVLAREFLARAAEELGSPAWDLADDALVALSEREWPGNVRELQNAIHRAVLFCEGPVLGCDDLESSLDKVVAAQEKSKADLVGMERLIISRALDEHDGNRSAVARALGIHRSSLLRRLRKFGLD